MSRTSKYLQRKMIERLPKPALDLVGKAVVQGVDKAVADRWDAALDRAAEAEGDTLDRRVKSISRRFRREMSAVGAASGAVAAAPGLGTTVAASALVADLGWFAVRSADLIMTIGAAHGHTGSSEAERRAWVLAVLAYGEEAAQQVVALLDDLNLGTGSKPGRAGALEAVGSEEFGARLAGLAGGDMATLDALRRLNTNLAAQVMSRYGSRRGLLAVGKLLPFGIGAVVGGSTNYALTRTVGKQADRFFRSYQAPPGDPLANGGAPNLSSADRRNAIPTDGRPHDG